MEGGTIAVLVFAALAAAILMRELSRARRRPDNRRPPTFGTPPRQATPPFGQPHLLSEPKRNADPVLDDSIKTEENQIYASDHQEIEIGTKDRDTKKLLTNLSEIENHGIYFSESHMRSADFMLFYRVNSKLEPNFYIEISSLIKSAKAQKAYMASAVLIEMRASDCRSLGDFIDRAIDNTLTRPISQSMAMFLSGMLNSWGFYDAARQIGNAEVRLDNTSSNAVRRINETTTINNSRSIAYESTEIMRAEINKNTTHATKLCDATETCYFHRHSSCPLVAGKEVKGGICNLYTSKAQASTYYSYVHKPIHVGGHVRKGKNGKTIWVKPFNRRR